MRRLGFFVVALALSGCATLELPRPLTEAQIVALARERRPPAQIVEELKRTRTVLALGAADILRLHEAGVPVEVLEYLQRAQMDSIRWRARSAYGCCGPLYRGVGPCPWPPGPGSLRGFDPWSCY
ncbi:MAG: hypothetical protein AB1773_05520 [Pseudomonadota bacterium]